MALETWASDAELTRREADRDAALAAYQAALAEFDGACPALPSSGWREAAVRESRKDEFVRADLKRLQASRRRYRERLCELAR